MKAKAILLWFLAALSVVLMGQTALWPAGGVRFDDAETLQFKFDEGTLTGGGGSMFDFCRDGSQKGIGYDPITDTYAMTCANYPWSAEKGGSSTTTGAAYDTATCPGGCAEEVTCVRDGLAYKSGTSGDTYAEVGCLHTNQKLKRNVMADMMLALDHVRPNPFECTTFVPEFENEAYGVYLVGGCGQKVDGTNNTCPVLRYPNDWQYQRHVQPLNGRVLCGEGGDAGGPFAPTFDPEGDGNAVASVNSLRGTYFLFDTGTTFGGSRENNDEDPNGDGGSSKASLMIGPSEGTPVCTPISSSDPTCDVDATVVRGEVVDNLFSHHATSITDNFAPQVCIGSDIGTYTVGTCEGDPRVQCLDGSSTCSDLGLGSCLDYADALSNLYASDGGFRLRTVASHCNFDEDDCANVGGHYNGLAQISSRTIGGNLAGSLGNCSSGGKLLTLTTRGSASPTGPWQRQSLVYNTEPSRGGTPRIEIYPTNVDRIGFGHGVQGFTFVAAGWPGREGDDRAVTTTAAATELDGSTSIELVYDIQPEDVTAWENGGATVILRSDLESPEEGCRCFGSGFSTCRQSYEIATVNDTTDVITIRTHVGQVGWDRSAPGGFCTGQEPDLGDNVEISLTSCSLRGQEISSPDLLDPKGELACDFQPVRMGGGIRSFVKDVVFWHGPSIDTLGYNERVEMGQILFQEQLGNVTDSGPFWWHDITVDSSQSWGSMFSLSYEHASLFERISIINSTAPTFINIATGHGADIRDVICRNSAFDALVLFNRGLSSVTGWIDTGCSGQFWISPKTGEDLLGTTIEEVSVFGGGADMPRTHNAATNAHALIAIHDQGNTASGSIQGRVSIDNVHWHAPTQDEVVQSGVTFTPCLVSIEDEVSGEPWLDDLTGLSITNSSILQNKNLNGDPAGVDPLVVCEHDMTAPGGDNLIDVQDDLDIYDKNQPPILLRNYQQGLPAPDQPYAYIAVASGKSCSGNMSFTEAYYDEDDGDCNGGAGSPTGSGTEKVVCHCEDGAWFNVAN